MALRSTPPLALATGETDPRDRGQPFLELAVEPVLAMACVKLQQAHDQRARKPQKRRGKGRAHAAQLILETVHQPAKDGHAFLALAGLQRADGVDNGRNSGGQTKEGAQKPEKDQQVGDVSRDVAAFLHPGADTVEHRARRGSGDLKPAAPHPGDAGHRGQKAGRAFGGVLRGAARQRLDPGDRGKQLEDLEKAGQHADDEHDADGAVEIGRGKEHRLDLRPDQHATRRDRRADDQHQDDLLCRARDARPLRRGSRHARPLRRGAQCLLCSPWLRPGS